MKKKKSDSGGGIPMSTGKAEKKGARYWWLALLGLCFVPCAIPIACNGDPRAIVASIPDGSKLSELDEHIGKFYTNSSVHEWIPQRTTDSSERPEKTKHGSFFIRKLGTFDAWSASKAERDAFTGKLELWRFSSVIPDDLAPSYAVSLIYVNGVLKEKNYTFLPG